jgi:hypothetical protein
MRLRKRLQRLEQGFVFDYGCRACRERRGRYLALNACHAPDGSLTYLGASPVPCIACGEVPEFLIIAIRPDSLTA